MIRLITLTLLAGITGDVAAHAQETPPIKIPLIPNAAAAAPMEFYLAHGEAGACGHDCSEWIVADGKIDLGSASRLRQLLTKLGNKRPPIYFHSGGGSVDGSLALGRLIRARKLPVSVAHTIPRDCASDNDKAAANACESRKRSGEAIEAAIDPSTAMCNSACVYAVAAGTPRSVPPWVNLGIHEVGFDPKGNVPRGAVLAASIRLAHAHIRDYLREMGIDDALLTASVAVPNNTVRPLRREEVVRFGIDTREFGETSWQIVEKPKLQLLKRFFTQTDGDPPSYVNAFFSIDCGMGRSMHVAMAREHLSSDTSFFNMPPIKINVSGTSISLNRAGNAVLYGRTGIVDLKAFDAADDNTTIILPGSEFGRQDGSAGNISLSMDGFTAAYAKLRKECSDSRQIPQTASLQQQNKPSSPMTANIAKPGESVRGIPSGWVGPAISATVTLTRTAAARLKTRLDFFYLINADCSSGGKTFVRMDGQPQHGTLTIENGQDYTDYPKDAPLYACNSRKTDGILVFYQPNSDFHGTDFFKLYVMSPLGTATSRSYSVEVK